MITPSERIIKNVCDDCLSTDDNNFKEKSRDIVHPRRVANWLCRNMTEEPVDMIEHHICGMDHNTVIKSMIEDDSHDDSGSSTDIKENTRSRDIIHPRRVATLLCGVEADDGDDFLYGGLYMDGSVVKLDPKTLKPIEK